MARCYICDVELSEKEINFAPDEKLDPCTTCLNVIMDVAYSDGFTGDEEQIEMFDTEEEGTDES